MTHRRFILTGLALLPLGLAIGTTAFAQGSPVLDQQNLARVADNIQNGDTTEGRNEGNVEHNDNGQNDPGTGEQNGEGEQAGSAAENGGQDKGGANSEHEYEGEENGEN